MSFTGPFIQVPQMQTAVFPSRSNFIGFVIDFYVTFVQCDSCRKKTGGRRSDHFSLLSCETPGYCMLSENSKFKSHVSSMLVIESCSKIMIYKTGCTLQLST